MSDGTIVQTIAEQCVPVAVNLYKIRDAKDEAGEFFRTVQKRKEQYQGWWLVSPTGEVLAAQENPKNENAWTAEVRQLLTSGLRAFGVREPRRVERKDPLPFRGKGMMENGDVDLALFVRPTLRGRPNGVGVVDSQTFSAKEWAAFAPPELKKGTTWRLPNDVVRKFCKILSPDSDQSTMPRPNEVTDESMHGNVWEIANGRATLLYTGRLQSAHEHPFEKGKGKILRTSAALQGMASYDIETKSIRNLAIVFEGTYFQFPPWDKEPHPFVAGAEWRWR